MRLILVLLVAGCGGVEGVSGADAGRDAGDNDQPAITCDAGAAFCSVGSVWTCTLSGHDAVLTNDCVFQEASPESPVMVGSCSETACAGTTLSAIGGVYCCAQ